MIYAKPRLVVFAAGASPDCMDGSGAAYEASCDTGVTASNGCSNGATDVFSCTDGSDAATYCSTGGVDNVHTGCYAGAGATSCTAGPMYY